MKVIVVIVSPFGYGHLTRQIALIKAIHKLTPIVIRLVCSEKHQQFALQSGLSGVEFHLLPETPSPIMVDQYNLDQELTIESFRRHMNFETQIRDDVAWGRILQGADLMITDIECIQNVIAAKMKIPIINISNFTWSDFLVDFGEQELADYFIGLEQLAKWNFRLPFFTTSHGMKNPKDTGLLVGEIDEQKVNELRTASPMVMIASLPEVDFHIKDLVDKLNKEGVAVILSDKFGIENAITYGPETPKLLNYVAASNIVIGKTGYGFASECAHAETYFLHWKRTGSIEDEKLSSDIIAQGFGKLIPRKIELDDMINLIMQNLDHSISSIPSSSLKIARDILNLLH